MGLMDFKPLSRSPSEAGSSQSPWWAPGRLCLRPAARRPAPLSSHRGLGPAPPPQDLPLNGQGHHLFKPAAASWGQRAGPQLVEWTVPPTLQGGPKGCLPTYGMWRSSEQARTTRKSRAATYTAAPTRKKVFMPCGGDESAPSEVRLAAAPLWPTSLLQGWSWNPTGHSRKQNCPLGRPLWKGTPGPCAGRAGANPLPGHAALGQRQKPVSGRDCEPAAPGGKAGCSPHLRGWRLVSKLSGNLERARAEQEHVLGHTAILLKGDTSCVLVFQPEAIDLK